MNYTYSDFMGGGQQVINDAKAAEAAAGVNTPAFVFNLENIGITKDDVTLLVVIGVLVILAAFGGWLGEIGYWGSILLGVVALVSLFSKGKIGSK